MNICFGIISYLPEGDLRKKRAERLGRLLHYLDVYFPTGDVIIVAQNWHNVELGEGLFNRKITFDYHDQGLGINGARNRLREVFLHSDYDYLVMLDDDLELATSVTKEGKPDIDSLKNACADYIKTIEEHPDGWACYRTHLLKFFAISKAIYSQVIIPDGGADDSDQKMRYFEDQYMQIMLHKFFPEAEFEWDKDVKSKLIEVSNSAYDNESLWHDRVYNGAWTRRCTGNVGRMFMESIKRKEDLLDGDKLNRLHIEAYFRFRQWNLKHPGQYYKLKFDVVDWNIV